MDEYSGKKAGDGMVVSRKGSDHVLRDTATNRDRNAQFCNRIGCNGRLNSSKGTQFNYTDKAKSRASFRSSINGKELAGSSSRNCSATSNLNRYLPGPKKKLSSQLKRDPSETGNLQDVSEVQEILPPSGKIPTGTHAESDDAGSSETTSCIPNTRYRRSFYQKSGTGKLQTPTGLSISLAAKNTTRASTGGYGIRNLRCNSIADVISTGSSTSDSNLTRQKGGIKKRICEGESSSSARGKKTGGSPIEGRTSSVSSGISISDSRRTRVGTPNQDNNVPASVGTRRSFSYNRSRVSNQVIGNNVSLNGPHTMVPQVSEPVLKSDSTSLSSSHQFSMDSTLSHSRSYGLPGSSSEGLRSIRPSSPAEIGNIRSSINRDSFRRYNMDGIAEVLLALERIEQDEELTYEQVLVLETSLFLNGLNFYDQHRDMRLDIDNMSYEELLALEERMGTVSTALTEEALLQCLKTSIYEPSSPKDITQGLCGEKDDFKCSICQEEYTVGDEVAQLQCEHKYHLCCIHQWLRLKNWCPICKSSAAPAPSSSSLPSPPHFE